MLIPKLRSPIVLVHGLFGFNRIEVAGTTLASYFSNIPQLLTAAGNRVFVPALSPTGGVVERAKQLKAFILEHSPGEPVHLIAHSMGGLDSRYMISHLEMSHMVLTLTTVGTPHRGTSFADWGVRRFERVVRPLLETVGMPHQAFYDLTRASCKTFNDTTPDALTVKYFSVSGKHDGHFLHPEWLLPFGIVSKEEGDNDGIVSITSAQYGEYHETWEGDHLALVNWPNIVHHYRGTKRDPAPRYGSLLRRLADLGY